MTYETVSISAGIDSNLGLVGRYEYVIFAPNERILDRRTGFKSKATAKSNAVKATQKFLAD